MHASNICGPPDLLNSFAQHSNALLLLTCKGKFAVRYTNTLKTNAPGDICDNKYVGVRNASDLRATGDISR